MVVVKSRPLRPIGRWCNGSNPDFENAKPRSVRGRLAPSIELKADTESAKAAPNNEEIDRLVAELGSADFGREQATEKLIAAGPAAIDAVAKALKNDDFETSDARPAGYAGGARWAESGRSVAGSPCARIAHQERRRHAVGLGF